ncbi:MAG: hypothetical protein JWM11_2445 [Planctomycetaceae bacterium]|nr:hypothetical protein [Planctomycetaceae bacterium]
MERAFLVKELALDGFNAVREREPEHIHRNASNPTATGCMSGQHSHVFVVRGPALHGISRVRNAMDGTLQANPPSALPELQG